MRSWHLLSFLLFLLLTAPALAQEDPYGGFGSDTTYSDSTEMSTDTTDYYYDNNDSDYNYDNYDNDSYENNDTDYSYDDYSAYYETPFFSRRSGFFIGPTIEFTELKPSDLDPDLSGDIILFGGEVYTLIKGWMLGGAWVSATLYDLSPKYDEFSYGYGGFITGYDQQFLYQNFSIKPALLIGGGQLTQIKQRPDIPDSTGHPILERYRDESFFLLRPGISLGYMPLPFLEFRLTVDYMYPVGGASVGDLRKMTYGLQLLVGGGG